ncbi:MAG: RNA methyltransferase [Parachlamydiales bacterium]|nr:RNA methyltransferase [Parachlamydiales bacterium]
MVPKKITSLQHPIVKEIFKLRTQKKYRYEKKELLISGQKMIQDLFPRIKILFLSEKAYAKHEKIASTTYIVSEEVLHKITGVQAPDGYAALVDFPATSSLEKKEKLLIIDNLTDPGNLGTLLRSALAFGWDGVILPPKTVDPFNDKALRAAKGATFHLPLFFMEEPAIIAWIQKKSFQGFLADLKGTSIETIKVFSPPYFLILSHESSGTRKWAQKIATPITIPIAHIESLNVAAAGSILLYLMSL